MNDFPFLSLSIFFPLLSGIVLFSLKQPLRVKYVALTASLIELILTLALCFNFDAQFEGQQFIERHLWIPSLNIQYFIGLDGISLFFMPLTALLTSVVILASWNSVQSQIKLYLSLLLFLEGFTLGIYCALDLALFFLFWELSIIPIFFLASFWGIGPKRRHAAFKYAIFMFAGGILLLFGFILLAINHADQTALSLSSGLTFDYLVLLETPVPIAMQSIIFLLLFFGFAIKAPLFPFHVWLPTMAMEGPSGLSALLMGLKLGLFGILRFAIPLVPDATHRYFDLMIWLGVIGAFYGAVLALKQTNLRGLLAYSSISHVGIVLIGIAAGNMQGVQGGLYQLINFAIVSSSLFLIAGFLQHRLGSTDLNSLGGIAGSMPMLSGVFFILGLASIGVPGTNGFIAENLIAIGALRVHTGVGLAVLLCAILAAAYFLSFFQKAFLGRIKSRAVQESLDLRHREATLLYAMLFLVFALGLFPKPILDITQPPIKSMLTRLNTKSIATMLAKD